MIRVKTGTLDPGQKFRNSIAFSELGEYSIFTLNLRVTDEHALGSHATVCFICYSLNTHQATRSHVSSLAIFTQ